jgi:beta-lactamase class D/2-keto-3-deoxy-L-rhamnonate aldolase RhmA
MMLVPALALSLATLAPPTLAAGECVVVAPLNGPETVFGGDDCRQRTLPASTFKIPHALVALQTKVVTDKTVIKWDGTKKDLPAWERDHTLESAIKMSVVWVFQQFAAAIGRDRELEYLRAFRYGSATFEHDVTNFWLNGDLQISPVEQIAFLRRMFSYDLPIDRAHIDTVKADLTMPHGKFVNAFGVHDFALRWPADTIVRVKSGNGTVNGEHVSWLVGALETGGRQFVFASRARSTGTLDTSAGGDLALRVLNTIDPAALTASTSVAQASRPAGATHGLVELWAQGKPAFGVYAPNENPGPRGARGQPPLPAVYTREGGEKLATNPLYDYVFLNLEEGYDAAAVKAMADGLRSPNAVSRKALIVRIPPIDVDGAARAKARVKEALDLGADGVTIPHVTSLDEATLAISFFQEAKANVWSPSNPGGRTIAMLMLEDPAAVAQAAAIADLRGYSILACGIGSLRQALGGDRAGAEAGTQKVLVEAKRAKRPDMLTANPQDVEQRVKEGFLALLMQGPTADEAIRIGRAAAGR